jgi:hypothetical protein
MSASKDFSAAVSKSPLLNFYQPISYAVEISWPDNRWRSGIGVP